jgi:hypothetical protein
MRKLTMAALAMGLSLQVSAQSEAAPETKERTVEHHIGVQANALIREIFNFSNNNNRPANPYFLTYSLNFRKTGWGFRTGVGYNYSSFNTSDGITTTANQVNDLHVRLGAEKAFKLTRKWTSGVGVDLVYNNEDRKTSNAISPGIGGGALDVSTKTVSTGGGPMAWLRYSINDRIVLGTETSFYFVTGNETQNLNVSTPFFTGSGGFPSVSSPSNTVSKAEFSLPVAFFILIKF